MPGEGIGDNLAVLEQHELRVDEYVPPNGRGAATNFCSDGTVTQAQKVGSRDLNVAPSACVARVTILPWVLTKLSPRVRVILPALPSPVLSAEMVAPSARVTRGACTVISPPDLARPCG